jgi:hypothetical protein
MSLNAHDPGGRPMRVFALSDLHVDYTCNAGWVAGISGDSEGRIAAKRLVCIHEC